MAISFDAVFSYERLAETWEALKSSKTDQITQRVRIPPGWDGVGVKAFERQRSEHLRAIQRKVASGRYVFRPLLFRMQAKADGGERKIAYSGIRDRIVQAALHQVLAAVVEERLTDSAYAYRAGRGSHDAIRDIYEAATTGRPYFVRSDFVQFFDRLDHARLKSLLENLEVDPRARQLAWRFARTGDVDRGMSPRAYPPGRRVGVPQGGVVSGVLANLYLADFDRALRTIPGATLIRYADDFVVLCVDENTCRNVFAAATAAAGDALLDLHSGAKTITCGHINDALNFVGFRLRGTKVMIKPGNVAKFQARIDGVLVRHEARLRDGTYSSPDECLRQAVYHVNRKITGLSVDGTQRSWMTFFHVVNDIRQIRQLDRWIWKRLVNLAQRVGAPYRKRSHIFELGYSGLLREYWSTRRRIKARTLPVKQLSGETVARLA